MAKIWHHPDRVYDRVHRVSKDSADETLGLVQRKLKKRSVHPYATGALAASYHLETESVTPDGVEMLIASDSVYAKAIEEGSWGEGRGPHISGSGNVLGRDAGSGKRIYSGKGRYEVRDTARRDWGRRMSKKLRAGI
jgi:hypothetical protein